MIPAKVNVELGLRKTVKGEWDEYSRKIFSGINPSAMQREETQKAFYAGFYACLAVCLFGVTEQETEELGAEMLESLKDECEAFFKDKLKDYLHSKN